MARIAVFGAGYVGLVTGACFAELGHDVVDPRRRPRADRRAARRRGADPRAGPRGADRAERASACASRSTCARPSTAPSSCSSASARRRPTPATPTSPRVWTVIDELPQASSTVVLVMKSTVPVGHGREGARRARRARAGARRLRLEPGVPRRGHAPCATSCTPTASWSARSTTRTATRSSALHAGTRRADRAHRRRLGRDDQARRERVPRRRASASSTRSRTSASSSARTSSDVAAASVSTTGSARTSCGPASASAARCFPKDSRAQAARRQLRLPLPAARRGDRGERAAEAARRRRSCRSTSARCAARRSRCSGSPSSRTPTTCARRRASCSPRGCSPRAPRCAPGIRSPTRASVLHGVELARRVARGGARRRRGRDRHRVARAARRSPAAEMRAAMRNPLIIDGRNLLDPDACAPPASPTRASAGRPRRSHAARDAEPSPELRQASMEAIILAGGKAERLGDAARGRPKPLVDVGGQAARRVPGRAPRRRRRRPRDRRVRRGPGRGVRATRSAGSAPEIVAAEEPEPLGRGGGLRSPPGAARGAATSSR